MKKLLAGAFVALGAALVSSSAFADGISDVEGARARDRAGYHLTGQDRDNLRKYGRNDDWGYGRHYRGYGYYDSYGYGGPGVSIYVGPPRYYGRYGY